MPTAIIYNQEPILLEDALPQVGETLPFFTLVNEHLEDVTLDAFVGKRKIIHIFPSIDTPTSAKGVRTFSTMALALQNTAVIHVSADLPFALARFRAQEPLPATSTLSTLRGRDMIKNYGVLIVSSHLAGLPARAVLVADENHGILHVELVADLSDEPDYAAAESVLL